MIIIHGFWLGPILFLYLLVEGIRQRYFPGLGFESRRHLGITYEAFEFGNKEIYKFMIFLTIFCTFLLI
jgi:hypothetical protein